MQSSEIHMLYLINKYRDIYKYKMSPPNNNYKIAIKFFCIKLLQ
jgi:hypothetical protein